MGHWIQLPSPGSAGATERRTEAGRQSSCLQADLHVGHANLGMKLAQKGWKSALVSQTVFMDFYGMWVFVCVCMHALAILMFP